MNSIFRNAIPTILLGYLATAGFLVSSPATAQLDGPRVYWPLPKNTNIVTGHLIEGTANASWSNWSRIEPDVDIDSSLYLLGYTRVQPILGRTVYWQGLLPSGTVRTSSLLPEPTSDTFASGIGDLSVGATVNLFGAPEMMAKDWVRHELDWSVNLGLMVSAPTGQYDPEETLNIGSNQWKTRISAPIVKSFGEWVPGKRTTLEIMPAVTLLGDNDSAQGNRIEQDPLYSIEMHLTRDITENAYISLDYTWLDGGEETYTDLATGSFVRESGGISSDLLGVTLQYNINDNMRLFMTHMQALDSDSDSLSLDGSITKITLSWSWHDVLERVQRFKD
ncbi:MAG: transporter [Xanthomonadales bacterium]|nr:transporter [Xanthomonadales bacterium]